jgi:hypothetical protein
MTTLPESNELQGHTFTGRVSHAATPILGNLHHEYRLARDRQREMAPTISADHAS